MEGILNRRKELQKEIDTLSRECSDLAVELTEDEYIGQSGQTQVEDKDKRMKELQEQIGRKSVLLNLIDRRN